MSKSLKSFANWFLFTLVMAVAAHFATAQYLPDFIMSRVHAGFTKQSPPNTMLFPDRPDASSRQVVRPSPNLLYGLCVYDVSNGPIRITAPVPPSYWSLSAFADTTDNYLAINDRQAGGDVVDLILAMPGTRLNNPDRLPVIDAKTPTGVLLTRTLITSEEAFPDLDALRRQASCAPYSDKEE